MLVLREKDNNARDVVNIGESAENILVAHRRILDTKAPDWAKEKAVVKRQNFSMR